ncbi:unnamed protein product [Prunus armeniaca]
MAPQTVASLAEQFHVFRDKVSDHIAGMETQLSKLSVDFKDELVQAHTHRADLKDKLVQAHTHRAQTDLAITKLQDSVQLLINHFRVGHAEPSTSAVLSSSSTPLPTSGLLPKPPVDEKLKAVPYGMPHSSTGPSLDEPKTQLEAPFSFGSLPPPHYTQHTTGPSTVPHDQGTHPPRRFDNDVIRHIKPTAPTFDGRGDPTMFLDWVQAMEDYFAWYNLADAHKLRIGKMTLQGAARQYWNSVEEQLYQFGQPPVTLWDEMKLKLREQYLPTFYRHQLYVQGFVKNSTSLCLALSMVFVTISSVKYTGYSGLSSAPTPNRSTLSSTYGVAGPPAPTIPTTEKGPAPSTAAHIECYRCHAKGHIASRCPHRTLTVGSLKEDSCVDVYVEPLEPIYDPELDNCCEEAFYQVSVMRCIYSASTPPPPDSWKRTSIFQTYVPCGTNRCQLVIDGGSTLNVISKAAVDRLHLQAEPHPHPFHVGWVDTTMLPVTERCLVPLQLGPCHKRLYCDILPMSVAHVLLGRPWLYDRCVKSCGRENTYTFQHEGKNITLTPSNPAIKPTKDVQPTLLLKEKASEHRLSSLSFVNFAHELQDTGVSFALLLKPKSDSNPTPLVEPIHQFLPKFSNIIPDDLPDALPPAREIQHAIDLIPGSQIPNLPYYCLNLSTRAELNRKIQVLLDNCFIRHSLNPCVVLVLLTPKKDGSWQRCVDGRTVNNITGFIPPPVPRSSSPSSTPTDKIEDVSDHEVVASSPGDSTCFLVHWVGRPATEDTWIT